MAIQFTPQQEKVLCARKHNILVSAAAGSGKTAVLVERIIRMITEGEHPSDIDRLLVVTFTRAAAAQMRERIAAAIALRLQEDPGNEDLQKQETLMHGAQITTMDSFFTVLVRNQFSEIGLDPAFRQMDEDEAKLLKADVMDAYMEQLHEEGDPDFHDCLEFFCQGGGDERLAGLIDRLYERSTSHPDPQQWLRERETDYEIGSEEALLQTLWLQSFLCAYYERALELTQLFDRAVEACLEPGGPFPYEAVLRADKEAYQKALGDTGAAPVPGHMTAQETGALWTALRELAGVKFGKLPPIRNAAAQGIDKGLQELVKKRRETIKESIASLAKELVGTDADTELEIMREVSPRMKKLAQLAAGYGEAYARAKREKNVIDFSDLEHFALQILAEKAEDGTYVPRRAALAYKEHYDEILIDEYQDSSDVQEVLLRIISTEDEGRYNRFMVGDVKQSIYKFRQARPEIFMEKYGLYREDDPLTERIDLDSNFRSRAQVLDSVNAVFARIMRREIGGVQYDGAAALKTGAVYPEAADQNAYRTEILITDTADTPQEETEVEESASASMPVLSRAGKEALMTAARIRELVGTLPVTEDGVQRPCRFGDIVILMRSPKGWDEIFREVLEQCGIPVYVESRAGYYAAQEIRTVLQLLQVLDNPRQDIPLYGVMHSYFGGFTEEEAARIRVGTPEGMFYDALVRAAREPGEGGSLSSDGGAVSAADRLLREKAAGFLDFLDTWRRRKKWLSIHALVEALLEETGYEDHCRALPGGEQRGANLHMLKAQAVKFDSTAVSGLFSFVRYIEQTKRREMDYGEANILGEGADVVRIMSIHKSKGLEFPVCFVCGLSKRYSFLSHDSSGSFILDNDWGAGTDLFVPSLHARTSTLRARAIADKIRRDSLGEELRVLYVAMTRAKEKLILTGSGKDPEQYLEDLQSRLPASVLKQVREGLVRIPFTGEEDKYTAAAIGKTSTFMELLCMAVLGAQEVQPGEEDLFAFRFYKESDLQKAAGTQEEMDDLAAFRQKLETLEPGAEPGFAGAADTLPDPALAAALEERFSRRYAGERLDGLYTMTSVSELKMAAIREESPGETPAEEAHALFPPEEISPVIPFFAGEGSETAEEKDEQTAPRRLRGTDYGTAVHRLLELFPYERFADPKGCTKEELDMWRRELAEQGRIPQLYAEEIPAGVLLQFLRSPLAARMAAAHARRKLFREQPFVLGVPASRLGSGYPEEETVLVQGIMDAFFEEEGGLVLVDYKTDRVSSAEELAGRYKVQMDYYAEALERITGRKVRQKILFSFGLKQEIEIL